MESYSDIVLLYICVTKFEYVYIHIHLKPKQENICFYLINDFELIRR